MIGLLEGHLNNDQILRGVRDYNIALDHAFYSTAVLVMEEDTENRQPLNPELLGISLKNLTQERLEPYGRHICINYLGTVVVIAGLKSTQEHKDFIARMDQICKLAKKQYGLDTAAGIGRIYGVVRDIPRSFAEAKEAAGYRMLIPGDQAIFIDDVEPRNSDILTIDEDLMRRLISEIKVGNETSLRNVVEEVTSHLKRLSASMPQLRLYCTELIIELTRVAVTYRLESKWESTKELLDKVDRFHSFDEISMWLSELCLSLQEEIGTERLGATRLLGEKAEEFIREHYADSSLNVDMLCSYLGVGTTYFSTVFKKETGMNFVAYLTKIRMDEAVRLLQETDEKSYVIAGMVGYEEPTYFSYVFKKQFGTSPAKYRQKKA